jgi:hypothetical protein
VKVGARVRAVMPITFEYEDETSFLIPLGRAGIITDIVDEIPIVRFEGLPYANWVNWEEIEHDVTRFNLILAGVERL